MRQARRRLKRLPEKLIQIREELKLTQRQMAERLGVKGHRSIISKYERAESMPPHEVVLAYARAGKVTMESIVDDEMNLVEGLDFQNG